jgi:hypothetical protein
VNLSEVQSGGSGRDAELAGGGSAPRCVVGDAAAYHPLIDGIAGHSESIHYAARRRPGRHAE